MQLDAYKRLLALSKAGLFYAKDAFDKERYEEIKDISLKLINGMSTIPLNELVKLTTLENGYPTPKIDVRALIVVDGQLLLVEDSQTKEWSLPGGFAEVGLSPKENIMKEVKEETGYDIVVDSLGGLFDTDLNKQQPQLFQYYKLVFNCTLVKGEFVKNRETSNCQFFAFDHLPKLSEKRTTKQQLDLLMSSTSCYFD